MSKRLDLANPRASAPRFRPALERLEDRLVFSVSGPFVAGMDSGGAPIIRVYDPITHIQRMELQAYAPTFSGGVRVAPGDINADGVDDFVTGAGPGGGPHVKVFDGRTGAVMHSFFAFHPSFAGGVNLAVGDVNNDGFLDILTAAGPTGGPHVKVFDGAGLQSGMLLELRSFFAYAGSFRGGVNLGAADVNNDGHADIITGAGPGGGPHVKVFDGMTGGVIRELFAYHPSFTGGVYVAGGDITGDGFAEIVAGPGQGGGPHVVAFNGQTGAMISSFFAYAASFAGGVRVAVHDANSDGVADIMTAAGPGGGPHLKVFNVQTVTELASFFPFAATFTGGVQLGGQGSTRTSTPGNAVREVAGGGMNLLRAVTDALAGGLPRNEASQSELNLGVIGADTFVPAQVGYEAVAFTSSHRLRQLDRSFTAGLTTAELRGRMEALIRGLENILATSAFTDPVTGGKALYQVHRITGVAPRSTPFERTISALDNAQLVVGLQAAASYLAPLMPDLAARIEAMLGQFDLSMWLVGGQFLLGGEENPRAGGAIDRITSEGRLMLVAARARGEATSAQLAEAVSALFDQSTDAASPGGIVVHQAPAFGTALEIWAVTPFLTTERSTLFGSETLEPLTQAVEEARVRLGLPAAGATGVADGNGGFRQFGLRPTELTPQHLEAAVIISPAVGMEAGAMGTALAVQNLAGLVTALKQAGQFNVFYGVSNYFDQGSGLVNSANPVRGTLEIGQMTVALLNQLLGGSFLENLLRQKPGWQTALGEYAGLLNFREAELRPSGNGGPISRPNASNQTVWHIVLNEEVTYTLRLAGPGNYGLIVHYSNDDTGALDRVEVRVNGSLVGDFQTQDTGDWNIFTESPTIPLGNLSAGPVQISLRLPVSDGFGIDFDRYEIVTL